jgi:RHS repeat-associated protein
MKRTSNHRLISGALAVLLLIQCGPAPVWAALTKPPQQEQFPGHPLPVDIRNGEMVIPSEDLKVGFDNLPLIVRRVHRSGNVAETPGVFGYGWHCVVDVVLRQVGDDLQLTDEAGRVRTFVAQADGSWVSRKYAYEAIRRDGDGTYVRHLKNGISYHFGASNRLSEMRDRNGRFIRILRDDNRSAILLTDGYGRHIEMLLNDAGQVVRMLDNAGRMCLYSYDENRNMVAFRNRAGGFVRYRYDSRHRLTGLDTGGGRTYAIEYKGGRIAAQATPLGTIAKYRYSEDRDGTLKAKVMNAAGAVTSYAFAADGAATITDPTGVKSLVVFNKRELPVSASGPDGKTVTIGYDTRHNVVSLNENGAETAISYDPDTDLPVSIQSAGGASVELAYDARGNCVSLKNAFGGVARLAWNQKGYLMGVELPSGRSIDLSYDKYGQAKELTENGSAKTLFDFTMLGVLRGVTLPTGVKLDYVYDPLDRVLAVRTSEGQETRFMRNAMGQITRVVDAEGNATSYEYDMFGLVEAITDPLGATTLLEHGLTAEATSFTDANGNTTRWACDPAGRLLGETDPLGAIEALAYNEEGQLVRRTNARGQATTFSYGEKGRLLAADENGRESAFKYDSAGRLVAMSNPDTDYQFSFGPNGAIDHVADGMTDQAVRYEYNEAGQRVKMTVGDKVTRYKYNEHGLLSAIESETGRIAFQYDDLGRRGVMTYPNGVKTTYAYDGLNRITEIHAVRADGSGVTRFRYTYDNRDNRTSMIEGEDDLTKYEYDAANRLVRVVRDNEVTEYRYDAVGNRTSVAANGELVKYETGKDNRLLKASKKTFAYDADGNVISRTTESGETYAYEYDVANRLVGVKGPAGIVTYSYAPNGARVGRAEAGQEPTRFVFDQEDVIAELQGDTTTAEYTHGPGIDEPLAMQRGDQSAFFHADALGSIRKLSGDQANDIAKYDYGPFGTLTFSENAIANPYKYTARRWDAAADAYFYRARFMQPELGRFLSQDPLGLLPGPNRYIYANNNPVLFIDPSGALFGIDDAIAAGIGAIGGIAGTFINDVVTGERHSWQDYCGAAAGGAAGAWAGYNATVLSGGNVVVGGAVGGAVSSAVNQGVTYGLNEATGVEQDAWDWGNFFGEVAVGAGIGGLTGGIMGHSGLEHPDMGVVRVARNLLTGNHPFTASTALQIFASDVILPSFVEQTVNSAFSGLYSTVADAVPYATSAAVGTIGGMLAPLLMGQCATSYDDSNDSDSDGIPYGTDNDRDNDGVANWNDPDDPEYDPNSTGGPMLPGGSTGNTTGASVSQPSAVQSQPLPDQTPVQLPEPVKWPEPVNW